jgi:hypothetical protein
MHRDLCATRNRLESVTVKSLSRQSVPTRCRKALADGYLEASLGAVLGANGFLSDYQEALLNGHTSGPTMVQS